MARPSGELIKCGGRWTQAKYNSFIKSTLRGATKRWAPISDCLKAARKARGLYLCAECQELIPATKPVDGKRKKNAIVDHIKPVINPETGFTTWDECIENMFCEQDNLQVLCLDCHTIKCNEERAYTAQCRRERNGL